jgi:hypothetical protein
MFEAFPKKRTPLPDEFQKIYTEYYRANREGQTTASAASQKMESWLHRRVAQDVRDSQDEKETLELGAGTLNQLMHEPVNTRYDIVEPFAELFTDSPRLDRVRNVYADMADVPADSRYDRITSIATLEHIANLPEVVARSGVLLAQDGVFRASVPSEGTILWRLGWTFTTGLEFRIKYGLNYGILMKYEHVNTAKEIEEILQYFFDDVKCSVFGLSRAISLYRYYECRSPDRDRCDQYLASATSGGWSVYRT